MSFGPIIAVGFPLVSCAIAIAGLIVGVRQSAKKTRDDLQARMQAEYQRGLIDGRAARDDEVSLLKSQRDDARRERNEAQQRADFFEREQWRRGHGS